jgi:hypothetical protein
MPSSWSCSRLGTSPFVGCVRHGQAAAPERVRSAVVTSGGRSARGPSDPTPGRFVNGLGWMADMGEEDRPAPISWLRFKERPLFQDHGAANHFGVSVLMLSAVSSAEVSGQ